MIELSLGIIIFIIIVAFLCEYIDSTLGMGYGTILTPVLLILGFKPLEVVPVVLLSELITGFSAAFFHHQEGNVNLKPNTVKFKTIIDNFKSFGIIKSFKEYFPLDLKVALVLAACSILGTVVAVFIALNISKFWLQAYIGSLVLLMGVIIIFNLNKKYNFSWRKVTALGLIASFNKGISGGGYGPLITGGQILVGVESKSAIGITSLAEGLTCAVGIITYISASQPSISWKLAPYVILGAILSVPFSAKSVKIIDARKLKLAIALLTIFLGIFTLVKLYKF